MLILRTLLIDILFCRRCFAANSVPSTEDRLKKKDKVDEKFQLIYKPKENGLLMTATSFCAFGSFTCPAFLLQYSFDRYNGENMELVEQVSELQVAAMGVSAIACMLTLYFCRCIPLRIYNHEKEYKHFISSLQAIFQ